MYLSSKNKAAERLLAITHCNNCYSVFSLQFLPPWEMHEGNHMWTMTEVGRHLRRSRCPMTLFYQGHLEPAAQFSIQTFCDYLQDGDPETSLGNQCQCLVTLHKEGCPVILKDEAATIKLCSCQASDSHIRPFKHSEISHATSTPSSSCSFNPLRSIFTCFSTRTFWNFPFSVLPFVTLEKISLQYIWNSTPLPTHAWRYFRYLFNLNLSKFLFCCSQRCRGGLWYQIFFISIQWNIILKA